MKLSDKTVYLALMMVERELDCYRSNLRRECYTDPEQRTYVENLVDDLEKAVVELQALWYNTYMTTKDTMTKREFFDALGFAACIATPFVIYFAFVMKPWKENWNDC